MDPTSENRPSPYRILTKKISDTGDFRNVAQEDIYELLKFSQSRHPDPLLPQEKKRYQLVETAVDNWNINRLLAASVLLLELDSLTRADDIHAYKLAIKSIFAHKIFPGISELQEKKKLKVELLQILGLVEKLQGKSPEISPEDEIIQAGINFYISQSGTSEKDIDDKKQPESAFNDALDNYLSREKPKPDINAS